MARSRGRRLRLALVGALLLATGCGAGAGSESGSSAEPDETGDSPASSPSPTFEPSGTFDVGGHDLFLQCAGNAPPTVVYLHGSITEENVDPHANGIPILRLLSADHRVCVYDRRNLAHSDTVDAPQRPADTMADLHRLLEAAQIEPPYVLLGASFGGALAYLYANTYPDDVVAMVMLDAMFPDELKADGLFPAQERYRAFDAEDENESLERISHYQVLRAAQRFIGNEPAIPMTYLASIPEGYGVDDYGIPEYAARIVELQREYVERFSPGRLVPVDAPHFMEPVIPEQIAEEVRAVIEEAGF